MNTEKNLTPEQALNLLKLVKPEQVMWTYTGKPGCACGCNGKYRYQEQYRAAATENRGYPVTVDELTSAATAKAMLKRMTDSRMAEKHNSVPLEYMGDGQWAVETGTRDARDGRLLMLMVAPHFVAELEATLLQWELPKATPAVLFDEINYGG